MSEEEKKMALALREWALQKVFGPALTEIEEDLRKLYAKGRDKLILATYRKDFGNFPEIALPAVYAPTLDELLKKAGLVGATAPSRPEHDS
jgi:hypothetical protein